MSGEASGRSRGREEASSPDGPGGGPGRPEEDSGAADEAARSACELCGGETLERHCKIVCLRCGYTRDCSDP